MTDANVSSNLLVFAVLPYVAIVLFAVGTVERMLRHPFSVSSGSSQLLESRRHFWAIVPFHYGIIAVLIAHLVAFVAPRAIVAWNASAARLFVLEVLGLAFGLLALGGFITVVLRRATVAGVRRTTHTADWIVYAVLLIQLATGVMVATNYRWGSSWSTATLTPYLWSIVMLQPDLAVVTALPLGIQIHVAGAFVLIAVFPFSRLVHIINVPNPYLWRRPQVVRWYRPQPRRVEG